MIELSRVTQAILLLVSSLDLSRKDAPAKTLTNTEYGVLAARLRGLNQNPSDLLGPGADAIIEACADVVEPARLRALLHRGYALSNACDTWAKRSIWVRSRADADYPQRWKSSMKQAAPPLVYGCGDPRLLRRGGLAVVGSRDASDDVLEFVRRTGALCAAGDVNVVSGGARGVDSVAMLSALASDGTSCGVLASDLLRAATRREYREGLGQGRLALVSAVEPGSRFHVGHAMQRNRYIYALADLALVAESSEGSGGTWTGAVEQLDRLHFAPVHVRGGDPRSAGLDALLARGAKRWPDPHNSSDLRAIVERREKIEPSSPPADTTERVQPHATEPGSPPADATDPVHSDTNQEGGAVAPVSGDPGLVHEEVAGHALEGERDFDAVRERVVEFVQSPRKVEEVAEELSVERKTARLWLDRLVREERVTKLAKPVRYVWRQPELFEVLREQPG